MLLPHLHRSSARHPSDAEHDGVEATRVSGHEQLASFGRCGQRRRFGVSRDVAVAGDGIEDAEVPTGRVGRLDAVPASVALGDGGVFGPTIREEGEQQGLVDGVVGDDGDPFSVVAVTRAVNVVHGSTPGAASMLPNSAITVRLRWPVHGP
jgi:hypothetical protein